jgi:hypothetical protein
MQTSGASRRGIADSHLRLDRRHCEPTGRANARPMTGSAKQSVGPQTKHGLLRRFRLRSLSYGGQVAPRNDGPIDLSRLFEN